MNSETSPNPFPTSSTMGSSGTSDTGSAGGGATQRDRDRDAGATADSGNSVHRMAQRAHEAVDRLEQTFGSSSERVMGMQQEYGDYAREQVRDNPLAALGVAFLVGIVFGKLFMH